jgi:hypothetical protein
VQAQRKEFHVNAINQILRILPIPKKCNEHYKEIGV